MSYKHYRNVWKVSARQSQGSLPTLASCVLWDFRAWGEKMRVPGSLHTQTYKRIFALFIYFLMWTIFKVLIGFVTILLLFHILVFWPQGMWNLSSPTRDRTQTPFTGRRSLNHWTSREVPRIFALDWEKAVGFLLISMPAFFNAETESCKETQLVTWRNRNGVQFSWTSPSLSDWINSNIRQQ